MVLAKVGTTPRTAYSALLTPLLIYVQKKSDVLTLEKLLAILLIMIYK